MNVAAVLMKKSAIMTYEQCFTVLFVSIAVHARSMTLFEYA